MEHTYSIANDSLNGIVYTPSLLETVTASTIGPSIDRVNTNGDTITFYFNSALTVEEIATLDNILSHHDGAIPDDSSITPFTVQLQQKDKEGKSLMAIEKPVEDFDTIVTPNFTQDGTLFEIKPAEGKYINIHKAECQFEHDLQIAGITKFHLDYYVWYHHPQAGIMEVVGATREFDSIRSLFELGNEHYHSPAIGAEMPTGLTTISFSYPSKLKLHGDYHDLELSKLVCRLDTDEGGNPKLAGGSYVTIGFVTTSGDL